MRIPNSGYCLAGFAALVFFTGQVEFLEGAADGRQGAGQAKGVAQLFQGEVGLRSEELADFGVAFGANGWGAAAGVGAWQQRAGGSAEAEIVGHTVDGDAEEGSNGGQGANAAIHGSDDPGPQLKGVSFHEQFHGARQRNWALITQTIMVWD